MKALKIADGVNLPLDIVTQTIAILAKRRAGKSYTMRKLAEQLLDADQQVVLVDPKGDQWGIRSSADGKKAGYPIVILGGEHGDVPLEVSGGEVVAKLVVEERVSVLLDLSTFRKHEVATFMTAFLENLYRLKAQEIYRTPVMLVIDEADAIAPQKPQKGEERMLGAAEDIVRRGGQRGIGCALITQRSAVLNKNVLTQAQMLVVLRTIAPQDLAAMKAWVDVHGTIEEGKELMDSLPSLPIGDAWFWSPGWPTDTGIFKRSHVFPIETFDSGATPAPGQKKIVPRNLADVNLEVLKKQMASTIEKAKNDDPKMLKKRIEDLECELVAKKGSVIMKEVAKVEYKEVKVPVLKEGQLERLEKAAASIVNALNLIPRTGAIRTTGQAHAILKNVEKQIPREAFKGPSHVVVPNGLLGSTPLSKGARSVLSYLHSVYPHWKSKTQLWVAAGYSPGGGFNNIIYELTGAGLIEKDGSGKYAAVVGPLIQHLIDPSFDASLSKWDSKLSLGARKVFNLLLQNPDERFNKEYIAQETGYALGGGFNNLIYELTGKELVIKVGTEYQINPEILDL